MRRPYEVYKKKNELLKKALTRDIQEKIRVCPKNCRYNHMVKLNENGLRVSLCGYGQHPPADGRPLDISKIIVCDSVKQAQECNARIPLFGSEEAAHEALMKELEDPKIRRERYAEIVALEWVMDNDLHLLKTDKPSLRTKIFLWLAEFFENRVRQRKFVNKLHQN